MLFTTSLALSSLLSFGLGASASPLLRRNSTDEVTPQWCAPSVYGYETLISASQASEFLPLPHSNRNRRVDRAFLRTARAKWFPDGDLDGHFASIIVVSFLLPVDVENTLLTSPVAEGSRHRRARERNPLLEYRRWRRRARYRAHEVRVTRPFLLNRR